MYENPEVAFGGTANLLTLIELIYSAVDRPELWPEVAERIASASTGESTALFARFPTDSVIGLARFQSGSFEEYADYYSNVNVWMNRCDERFPESTVRYSHLVIEDSELEATEFYADFLRRWKMYYSFGIKVPLGDHPAAYISCQRPKAKGPFEEIDGVIYQTLLPHLQRALMLHFKLSQADARTRGLEGALEAFSHGVLGLDRNGRVIFCNLPADVVLRSGHLLRISKQMLVAADKTQNARLQALISGATAAGAGFGLSAGGWIALEDNDARLSVAISPIRSPLPGYPGHLAALVYLTDPATKPLTKAEALRALYGLSPSEARVADLLCAGLDAKEISNHLGMTLETARFNVKRILKKTGTRKQSELVRMMLSIPAFHPCSGNSPSLVITNP